MQYLLLLLTAFVLSARPLFAQVASPPTVRITLSAPQLRPEETLTVGLEVQNPAGNPAVDLYVGALFPDGQTVFFSGPGRIAGTVDFGTPALFHRMQEAPPGFSLKEPSFFQFTFPTTGVAPGLYRIFAGLVRQGALQDNRIDPGDILALDVEPFELALGRFRLATRGLFILTFDRRGFPFDYPNGLMIRNFNIFDSIVRSTVAQEVSLQLDKMSEMGLNTISFELRSADKLRTSDPRGDPFVPPDCPMHEATGLLWPQPTPTELSNLRAFFDLIQSKGMRVFLILNNTHMEEQPPTRSETWLGAILNTVKDHPALDLVMFGGNTRLVDTNGDGVPDVCGVPAEAPLYLGPTSVPAQYVKFAIHLGLSLGIPARKLSAEAIIGDFLLDSQAPAGPEATDRHLWSPVVVMKMIFDDLGIPDSQRTYALSFYQRRKCSDPRINPPCIDADPHTWAEETLQSVLATVGRDTGARVVAAEMGVDIPLTPAWPTRRALESLISLMEKHGVEGGNFWRWVAKDNDEDADPAVWEPVKRRGVEFQFTPTQKEILDVGGFHLTAIPNGSFEADANLDNVPDNWTVSGNGIGFRYFLAGEPGQPEVPSRGSHALRLVTGNGPNDVVGATSDLIAVTPNITYTTTANLRFAWTGDPNPLANPAGRPHVFVAIRYFNASGVPSAVQAQDVFRLFQEDSAQGFGTFPLRYTTPSDATGVRIEMGAARNGLATPITLDVDNLR